MTEVKNRCLDCGAPYPIERTRSNEKISSLEASLEQARGALVSLTKPSGDGETLAAYALRANLTAHKALASPKCEDLTHTWLLSKCMDCGKPTDSSPKDRVVDFKALADNAYCAYVDQMKRPECLGQEQKLKDGSFTSANIDAFMKAAEHLGRHRAFMDALAALDALEAEGGR